MLKLPIWHKSSILTLLAIMLFALVLGVWGINKNLPYVAEADEPVFVDRAIRIASTGNMNPEWFGHPGSTVIYPLALAAHIWHALMRNGRLLAPDPYLQLQFNNDFSNYYLIGRFLSLFYALLTLPLTYALGKRVFNRRVALIGAWLLSTYTIYWMFAQWVRTDMAASFWGLLSLWLCVRVYKRPSLYRYVWAGFGIGLSIASRYFMVTLLPILAVVWMAEVWNTRQEQKWRRLIMNGLAGFLAVVAGFALITPYFFIDFSTVISDLFMEARSKHVGADGLSKWQNFWWYLTVAFPQNITWMQTMLAGFGLVLAIATRKFTQRLLVAYVLIFLLVISFPALHWPRWIIQLLPLMALFVASVLDTSIVYASRRWHWTSRKRNITLLLLIAALSILPMQKLGAFKRKQSTPSTRVAARQWILENIPPDSKIGQEWYAAPLQDSSYEVIEQFSLSEGGSIATYQADGYRYLIASARIYNRYYAEPERYAEQIAFYDTLFNEADLVQQFDPSPTRGGMTIIIFKIP